MAGHRSSAPRVVLFVEVMTGLLVLPVWQSQQNSQAMKTVMLLIKQRLELVGQTELPYWRKEAPKYERMETAKY